MLKKIVFIILLCGNAYADGDNGAINDAQNAANMSNAAANNGYTNGPD